MTRAQWIVLACALCSGVAVAKLPPPTPEELAAQQARQAQEKAQLEREKALLEKVQDEVAERYRREHPAASGPDGSGTVSDTNIPYRTRETRPAGPHGGDKQSAEAHSAPAK